MSYIDINEVYKEINKYRKVGKRVSLRSLQKIMQMMRDDRGALIEFERGDRVRVIEAHVSTFDDAYSLAYGDEYTVAEWLPDRHCVRLAEIGLPTFSSRRFVHVLSDPTPVRLTEMDVVQIEKDAEEAGDPLEPDGLIDA